MSAWSLLARRVTSLCPAACGGPGGVGSRWTARRAPGSLPRGSVCCLGVVSISELEQLWVCHFTAGQATSRPVLSASREINEARIPQPDRGCWECEFPFTSTRFQEVAWVLVLNHLSHRSSIYTHRAHLHPLSSEIVWAGAIAHISQLRKLRIRCEKVLGHQQ